MVGPQQDPGQCQPAQPIFRVSGEESFKVWPNGIVDPKIFETIHPKKDIVIVQSLPLSQGPVLGIQVGTSGLHGVEKNELPASQAQLRVQPDRLDEQRFHAAGSVAALLDLAGE
jgi:hypothetical protein